MVDVETSPNCWKDAVTIYDGPSARSRELAQLCEHYGHGVRVQTFFSSGNNMFVHFRSDSQGERTGFRFQYQVINVANTTQMTTPEPVDVDTAKTVMTGLGVALVLIMIIALIIACLRSRYCPSQSQLTDDASVFNVRDMDSPVNAGHLGSDV
nr:hypothetical protein BaRGS_019845 [Batillaria attramentaria]